MRMEIALGMGVAALCSPSLREHLFWVPGSQGMSSQLTCPGLCDPSRTLPGGWPPQRN